MNGFKLLGEREMARTFECQDTEFHIRVVLLNRFSQLGRPVTVVVAKLRLMLGICRPQRALCHNASPN